MNKLRFIRLALGFYALMISQSALALTVETGVAVSGTNWNHTCDRIHWTDKQGTERVASLTQAGGQNSGSDVGGQLCQLQWNNGTTVKTATEYGFSDDLSGLGVTVNHYGQGGDYVTNRRWATNASSGFVFVGDHHAVWRFKSLLPIQTNTTSEKFPVTIDYVFKDGEDQFQYIVTYEASCVSGQQNNDSRGPYCEFDWASVGTEQAGITGQGYGTFRKILINNKTSAYSCVTGNVVPYIWEFTQESGADAELGYIATRPQAKHRAGNFLTYNAPGGALSSHKWEYQMNSMGTAGSQRCTWEVGYGALLGGGQTGITHKQENYSLSILIDKYSSNGVTRLVSEGEAIHNAGTSLTASVGSVALQGLESPGLARTIFFDKPGFDQVYRNWALNADNGQVAANLTLVSGKTISNPTFAVRNYSSRTKPVVQKNGTTLTEANGYYCSIDTFEQVCWVTYNSDFTGSTSISINGSAGSLAFTVLQANAAALENSSSATLTFTATVSGASNVAIDLSALGGGAAVPMIGSGTAWTATYTTAAGLALGFKNITATATSAAGAVAKKITGVQVNNTQDIPLFTDAVQNEADWQSWGGVTGGKVTTGGSTDGPACFSFNYTLSGWYAGLGLFFGGWVQNFNCSQSDTIAIDYKLSGAAKLASIVAVFYNVEKDTSALTTTYILDKNQFGAASNWTTAKFALPKPGVRLGLGSLGFNLSYAETGTGTFAIDNMRLIVNKPAPVGAQPTSIVRETTTILARQIALSGRTVILVPAQKVRVAIYDLLGNQYTAVNAVDQQFTWKAPNSGVFFCTISNGVLKETRRIVIR